jgi:hypothetical protein
MEQTLSIPDPIFELTKVPGIPYCTLWKREYRKDGKWYYAIINSYNSYGSGWANEDWIIEQIAKYGNK